LEADDVKKRTHENTVPVKERAVIYNYFHVCKQLFCVMQSKAVTVDQHLFHEFLIFSEEKGKKQRIKGKTMAQWI